VGRGATKQPLSAVASSSPEVFHLDPPLYFPPTLQQPPDTARSNVPFYKPPPPAPTFLPHNAQPKTVPSKAADATNPPEEGKKEYAETLASLKLSEKVHIVGFTREARFITHCLAGTPELPAPQLLTHHRRFINQWGTSQRKLIVRNREGLRTGYEIPIPEYVGKSQSNARYGSERSRLKHIDNLIISTADNAVIPTLLDVRDNISQDTTICLITPGLGLVEHVSNIIFPDPSTRPTFILGHSGHAISKDPAHQQDPYSIQVRNHGRLYLTGLSPDTGDAQETEVDIEDRIIRRARSQHLLNLLHGAPGLNTVNLPMAKFLRYKLPPMIFSSIADAISVALGFRYERIHADRYAQRLWRNLWDETIAIISELPELQEYPEVTQYFQGRNFATEVNRYLHAQRGTSQWISMVRDGQTLPMQGLNGWFVSRADELGLSSVYHRSMMNMVMAKVEARKEELKTDIPLYHSPYVLDNDCVRNDEEWSKPSTRIVYTNK
jgi:ketopantoate reductase